MNDCGSCRATQVGMKSEMMFNLEVMSEPDSEASVRRSRLISKVLSPAVRLWIQSQVEAVAALQVKVTGSDRQILSGHIPQVAIAAESVVYQGIALSQIALVGAGIRINFRDVLRGKSLQLVEPVPVQADATLKQTDINASLQTPLLLEALTDLVIQWLCASRTELPEEVNQLLQSNSIALQQPQIRFTADRLWLWGVLIVEHPQQRSQPFALRTGLRLVDRAKIQLDRPEWLFDVQAAHGQLLLTLQGFEIDLGTDVCLHRLQLDMGQLLCSGILTILP
jgi:hypothetical protein